MTGSLLEYLGESRLNSWIIETSWVWVSAEIIHFIGLIMLLGSIFVVDLSLLGVFKLRSEATVKRLLAISVLGFSSNLVTGLLFVVGDPFRYVQNIAFQLKMLTIVLLAALAFYSRGFLSTLVHNGKDVSFSRRRQLLGAFSLFFWVLVVVLGRLIPYVE